MNDRNGFYRRSDIELVKNATDIVSVISDDLLLHGRDGIYQCQCPFCKGEDNSFAVSEKEQLFTCVDCGETGDVFYYMMKAKGMSFNDSVDYLARRAAIEAPELCSIAGRMKKYDDICAVNNEAGKYFNSLLSKADGRAGLDYLINKRGLDESTITRFGLGYSGNGVDGLYRHLKGLGFTESQMENAGLISIKEGRIPGDKFRGRVMFPIIDGENHVVGFSGRAVNESPGRKSPKYLNTKETIVFDKKECLFGFNFAKNNLGKGVILCEGNLDVITLHAAGFRNSVAALGTAFGEPNAKLLREYTDTAYLTFDNDEAGVKATFRAIKELKKEGFNIYVADLAPYKDPDELIRNAGAAEFKKRLDGAENSINYEVRHLASFSKDPMEPFSEKLIGLPREDRPAYAEAMRRFLNGNSTEPELKISDIPAAIGQNTSGDITDTGQNKREKSGNDGVSTSERDNEGRTEGSHVGSRWSRSVQVVYEEPKDIEL